MPASSSWPVLVVACLGAAPLLWGACTEPPPPAQTPSVAIEDRGGTASGAPVSGDDSSPAQAPKPRVTKSGALDRNTQQAIDKELAALPPAKSAPLSFAECAALLKPTTAALIVALDASTFCKADSDCVGASDGTCMTGTCGWAVAKDHAAAYEAARKHIDEVACVPWNAGGCATTYSLPIPSCSPPAAACRAGRCVR